MRNILISSLVLLLSAFQIACTPSEGDFVLPEGPGQPATPGDDNEDNMDTEIMELIVNGRSFTATLVQNSSTAALIGHLEKGEVSIRMNDYADMEKVGALGFNLPRNDMHVTTAPGDLVLYQGNSLVIYYDTNSWSLTRLGKVDGVSTREEMLELLGGPGEITVTLRIL